MSDQSIKNEIVEAAQRHKVQINDQQIEQIEDAVKTCIRRGGNPPKLISTLLLCAKEKMLQKMSNWYQSKEAP